MDYKKFYDETLPKGYGAQPSQVSGSLPAGYGNQTRNSMLAIPETGKNLFGGTQKSSGASVSAKNTGQQNGLYGVRNYLTSGGLEPSKIGWENGQVTYGGRKLTPSQNINGTTYASKQQLDSFINDVQRDSGNIGIRKGLSGLGIDTSKLGWNNGQVTYGEIKYTPGINANGVTYAPEKDFYKLADEILKAEGNGLVQVNRYDPGNGLYDVDWNAANKQVLIGGKSVPYAYIDENGNAFALQSDLQAAYDELAKRNGVINPREEFDTWKENYADKVDAALSEIQNRQFTYDLESDPAYKAYKAAYEREAGRAYDDMLARTAARTGGNMSSMARSQAGQAYDYYMSQLADRVPELYAAAYERFLGDRNSDITALSQQAGLYSDIYDRSLDANNSTLDNYYKRQQEERQRITNDVSDKYSDIELQAAVDALMMQKVKDAYSVSDLLNTPISGEIAKRHGLMANADGVYPTANQLLGAKEMEYFNNVTMPQMTAEARQKLIDDIINEQIMQQIGFNSGMNYFNMGMQPMTAEENRDRLAEILAMYGLSL